MPQRLSGPRPNQTRWLFWSVAVVLLAAVLRLWNLGFDSLWFDEALTRNTAAETLVSPGAALGVRDHLPLLYWLTAAGLRLLPEHEVTLRLPSALAGVLAVATLIALGRAVRLPAVGLWAGLLLAVSPLAIRHAQEARHYALLLFFSLLSSYWLYRALVGVGQEPSGRGKPDRSMRPWLFFALAAVLNLLTHYSAWLLLAGQAVAAALYLAWRARPGARNDWRATLRAALPAALLLGAALLLLLGRAAEAFRANTGSAAGTTAAAPLWIWLRAVAVEFGHFQPVMAVALALLVGVGGLLLARQRPAAALLLIVPAVLPVLLIQLLGITRFALPKYVLYLLPAYLFAAATAIDAGLRRLPRGWRSAGSGLAVGVVLAVALPAVGREYRLMIHDWRGAAAAVGGADVVLAIALDTGDGFNAAGVMAPIYLDPAATLLDGNHLTADDLKSLLGRRGRVAALALHLYAPVAAGDGWRAANHQGSLYSLSRTAGEDDLSAQIASLYGQLIPQAIPATACDLALRLVEVALARDDLDAAEAALESPAGCPRSPDRARLMTAVRRARLAEAVSAGDTAAADQLAAMLLADDPRDAAALAVLTVADVLALFRDGQVAVDAPQSPEPVELRRFEMPTNGDWGDVVFAHPPAALSFAAALPDEPAALKFRVANDPQSWQWGGDGVTYVVTVQPADAPAREIFRRHISNDPADRRWHEVSLPLEEFAGQSVLFTLATETGPAGDGTGDWAGWDSPRIVRMRRSGE